MRLPSAVNILLLGSGGRECAFAWKIAQSPRLGKLYIATGNGGTSAYGTNVDISPLDFAVVGQFVKTNHINLVVVGSEDPLVKGIWDFFQENDEIRHVPVIGPSKAAAALEGSKDFAKGFMARHGVPTAGYKTVTSSNLDEGYDFLKSLSAPYVLKADGLAAGKGVLIIDNLPDAQSALREMVVGQKFGSASSSVVVEEFLSGVEMSLFVATDGVSYKILPEAKDYKRVGDGDSGLNTGGMGAISPVPFATADFMKKVVDRIVEPTMRGIREEGLPYKGFIFIGLINCGGEPMVIEYNVRMGDPETEAVLPRIKSDIVDLFDGIAHTTLSEKVLDVTPQTAATVIMTSGGYPEAFDKGFVVTGIPENRQDAMVFHAGTVSVKGDVFTAGGRVLAVTALADDVESASAKAYRTLESINYDRAYFRRDIGQDLLKQQPKTK